MRKKQTETRKRTIAAVLSLSVITTLLPFPAQAAVEQQSAGNTVKTQAVNDTGDDWLHTDGANILDKNGNIVRLTGANWFGFNCCECMLHGLGWGADLHATLKEIADRGINLLRIPVSTELLLAWKNGKKIGNDPQFVKNGVNGQYDDNPDLVKDNGEVMTNFEVFDQLMKWCKDYGIKVMVDVHSAAANNAGHNFNLWYGMSSSMAGNSGYTFTTQDWIDGWVWLVTQYKDDDTLIACDLKNEPHGKPDEGDKAAKWDDSEDENNWKYAAEKCGNAILDVNPNMLIMIEGIESSPKAGYTYADAPITEIGKYQVYTNYDGGWWGGNLRMAKDHPVDFKDAQRNKQIVYSPHDYGPKVYMQDWFHPDADNNTHFTEESLLKEYWYDSWAYLVEENRAPLLIGEWGGFMDGAGNEEWMNTIADYMNKKNISHTFWCINPNSGDTGGLINDDWKTWDEKKYALLKKTLWQSADGKFVGLDHQKALGKNGITIDEYYGNPQKPTQPATEETTSEAPTQSTTEVITSEAPTQSTTEETTSEAPTQSTTEVITSEVPTQPATEETTSEVPTQNTTRETTSEAPTQSTTEVITSEVPTQDTTRETTSEAPTETVTTETTIIDIPTTDAPTQRVTETTTEQTTPEETTVLIEKPKLDQASAAVLVGDSLQLTYSPDNTAGAVLRWESTNPDIVTVTDDGKITGVKEGEAVVLFHVDDEMYACVVSVKPVKQPETTENRETTTSQVTTSQNTTTQETTQRVTQPTTEEPTQATSERVTDASTQEPTQRVTEQPTQRVTETSEPTTTKQEPVTETTTKQEPETQPTTKQEPATEPTTKQTDATQPTSTAPAQNNISGSGEMVQKSAKIVKVAAVKGLKYKRQKATAGKLSWKKQKGAIRYRVYRYNKKTKKYQYYKATKKNYLALKKLKKKTTYQFKVRACQKINGKEVVGRYSKKVKVRI